MALPNTTASGLLDLKRELICFICTETLYQPLTVLDCLHSFCGSCLKEWFSHQHRKASSSRSTSSSSNPYTCPTCRATVKDVQNHAMVNTLLDMFLKANPDQDKTAEEKTERKKIYKRGDNILPKVERRSERRSRREGDEVAARERRMIEEARQRSLQEAQVIAARQQEHLSPPTAPRHRSSSRDREERRQRRRERERQRAQPTVNTDVARTQDQEQEPDVQRERGPSASPPISSPRHPDAVEARQRESANLTHQASLISLVSASESGTGTGDSLDEARIMEEIMASDLLEGVDVDNLTEAEQDMWAERIAEMYRQRHQRRTQPCSPNQYSISARPASSVVASVGTTNDEHHLQPGRDQERRRRSSDRPRANTTPSPAPELVGRETIRSDRAMPPSSTIPMQANASVVITHRRQNSDHTRRRATSQSHSRQSSPPESSPGSRSAIDISSPQQEQDSIVEERPRRLSGNRRVSTEPKQSPRASEAWSQAGVEARQLRVNGAQTGPSPSRSPHRNNALPRSDSAPSGSTELPTGQPQTATLASPPSVPSQTAPIETSTDTNGSTSSSQFDEPSVTCLRCSRENLQYDVHKHCNLCEVDLCMRCYRTGKGCHHWFGFGYAAMAKFEFSKSTPETIELPHLLRGRQYALPDPSSILESKVAGAMNFPAKTTSDPSARLHEGHFCDRCGSFANSQYWLCDICNDGEWGFCKECVHSHHTCTHPLLPVVYQLNGNAADSRFPITDQKPVSNLLTVGPPNNNNSSRPASVHSMASSAVDLARQGYIKVSISTTCDICHQAIPQDHLSFHCPFHPTPNQSNPNSVGDYDVCTNCYHNIVKTGRMRRDDGPAGWRKCPSGHRMIITTFEHDEFSSNEDPSLRRIIKHDLIGGWKMTEADMYAWTQARNAPPSAGGSNNGTSNGTQNSSPAASPPLPGTTKGTWSWREDSNSARRMTRARGSTLDALSSPNSGSNSALNSHTRFPPEHGFGQHAQALWSYYPDTDDADSKDELMFPRGALISEIEVVNSDWWNGVFAGDMGLFPAGYVRSI